MFLRDTDTLAFSTDAGTDVEFHASAVNDTGSALSYVGNAGASNSTTPVTILAAPSSGQTRIVKHVSLFNGAAVARVVNVRVAVSGTDRELRVCTLQPGEALEYAERQGWTHYDAQGRALVVTQDSRVGTNGFSRSILKGGTAAEAAASWYATLKDAGLPGAITVGTPGLAGRAVTSEAGCVPLPAASGSRYLTKFVCSGSVAHTFELWDLVWINSGLVVTTTTAQTINSVAFPARDENGATSGAGYQIGLLVTTATTNGAAIAGSTVSYTNSAGTAGRTATLIAVGGLQIPATAVAGTIVWFQLAAGDVGVQSIQSITLGTSLTAGAVSLIVARKIDTAMGTLANLPAPGIGALGSESYPGTRIYDGSSLFVAYVASATTATQIQASLAFADR